MAKCHIVVSFFAEDPDLTDQLVDSFQKDNSHLVTFEKHYYLKGPTEHMMGMRLPNVGREVHTILYHIVKHYEELPDYMLFLPGSWHHPYKSGVLFMILPYLLHSGLNTIVYHKPWEDIEQFELQELWTGGHEKNAELVKQQDFCRADVFPFGAWYKKHVPIEWRDCICMFSIFSVNKETVLRYPKEQYEEWLALITLGGANCEAAHFFERAWASIFL